MWVFWEINSSYQVGYFTPKGERVVVYDFKKKKDAVASVHFLNGGSCATFPENFPE